MYQQGAGTGMNSLEGLEGMRLWPKNEKEVNVGIGDFFAGGDDPTERLDVRTGRVRIRQLPTDPEANTLDQYMVVDDLEPNLGELSTRCRNHSSVAYIRGDGTMLRP